MRFVPYLDIDQSISARLDLENIEVPNFNAIKHLLNFRIYSYVNLQKINISLFKNSDSLDIHDEKWDVTFATSNQFMNSLSDADKLTLAQGLIVIHETIRTFFIENNDMLKLNQTMRDIGAQLDMLDQEMDLCGKIKEYIDKNMIIGIYERAGKRAQDSAELTFQPEQIKDLMVLTLLCKLLCPIFGEIMTSLNKKIDTKLKETHCVAILAQLFDRRYGALIEKLQAYIKHTVEQNITEEASGIMHGYDINTLSFFMYAQLMARQFVNIDLRVKDGNLMTYIFVSVKRSLGNIRSAIKKAPTFTRDPKVSKHDDDGNTSQLEIDSLTSRKTLDVIPIITASIPSIIKKYKAMYSIDDTQYEKALEYYRNHPITPNIINQDLTALFFARELGGGNGLCMLRASEIIPLVALLQCIVFSLDVNYIELGHILSANVAIDAFDTSINHSSFKLKVGSSVDYKNVKQFFNDNEYGFKGRDWDNHINRITQELTTNKFIFNTANSLWNWLEEDNLNGKVFIPSEMVVTALCSVYEFLRMTSGGCF